MDTSELEAAYRPVLDLAARVTDPEAGSGVAWGPGDVLAHLILNDRLVSRTPVSGLLATRDRAHLPMHRRQLSELLGLP